MLTSADESLLTVRALESGYGKIRVLHGVDMSIAAGEVVALLGPNGAGKTTLLRALSGLLPVNAGTVRFDGRDFGRITPRDAARAGLVHVIEGHRVFTQLSVTDNLLLAGYDIPRTERAARVEEALSFFPEIAEKRHERGGALSGGQVVKGPSDGKYNVLNGMLSIVIDPDKLGTGENLAREVESFVAWHTGSPPGPGVEKVKIAGEPERETKRKRLAEGIPVDPTTWQEILEAGKKFGLDQAAIETIAG